jgi:hypothetical protein
MISESTLASGNNSQIGSDDPLGSHCSSLCGAIDTEFSLTEDAEDSHSEASSLADSNLESDTDKDPNLSDWDADNKGGSEDDLETYPRMGKWMHVSAVLLAA